ncbi:MAG: hypothetical protein FJX23_09240, partial [Alphaproteobacteria bacterium]|nr:hypothetical protein [Alphaproteobacteria bacterium]
MSKGFFHFLLVVFALSGFTASAVASPAHSTYAPEPVPAGQRKPVASNHVPAVVIPAPVPTPAKPSYTRPASTTPITEKAIAEKVAAEKPAAKPAAPKPAAPAAPKPAPQETAKAIPDPNALKVAIMLSPSVKADDDKSFIQAVTRGVERAGKETPINIS